MAVNFEELFPEPEMVEVSEGKSFPVRGLAMPVLSGLLANNSDELKGLFENETLNGIRLITVFPDLAAKIIALGTDSVGAEESIKKLPAGIQLEAVLKIWKLTVPDLKKLLGLLSEATAALPGVKEKLAPSALATQLVSSLPSQPST